MSITFRIDDGIDTRSIIPANITPHQLGSLRNCLLDYGERLGLDLIFTDYGEPGGTSFSFEARVCSLVLSTVSGCFDHFPGVITVVDEAQFQGRRIRVWGVNGSPTSCSASRPMPMTPRNSTSRPAMARPCWKALASMPNPLARSP